MFLALTHLFDSSKWGRICKFLFDDGLLNKNGIVEPAEATKDDLLVVHSEVYLNSLKSSLNVSVIIEVPPVALLPNFIVQKNVLYPFRKQVAGSMFDPELLIYNSGTDILDRDPLGKLKVSPDGIANRDEKVLRFAKEKSVPLIMVTSGGYMKSSAKVIADSILNLSKKCLVDMWGFFGKNLTVHQFISSIGSKE